MSKFTEFMKILSESSIKFNSEPINNYYVTIDKRTIQVTPEQFERFNKKKLTKQDLKLLEAKNV